MKLKRREVAPRAGAWIEICLYAAIIIPIASLPVRERGLKSSPIGERNMVDTVAPRAGAWIEILTIKAVDEYDASLPVRERGLKLDLHNEYGISITVAPRAGAWIEIMEKLTLGTENWLSLPVRERGLKYHPQIPPR